MVGTGGRWTYAMYIFSAHGHNVFHVGLLAELSLSGRAFLYSHQIYLLDIYIYVSDNGHSTQFILLYQLPYYDYTSYVSKSGK